MGQPIWMHPGYDVVMVNGTMPMDCGPTVERWAANDLARCEGPLVVSCLFCGRRHLESELCRCSED